MKKKLLLLGAVLMLSLGTVSMAKPINYPKPEPVPVTPGAPDDAPTTPGAPSVDLPGDVEDFPQPIQDDPSVDPIYPEDDETSPRPSNPIAEHGQRLNNMDGRLNGIDQRLDNTNDRIDKTGAVLSAQLHAVTSIPLDKQGDWGIGAGYGNYNGESAIAVGVGGMITDDVMINGSISSDADGEEVSTGAGIGIRF